MLRAVVLVGAIALAAVAAARPVSDDGLFGLILNGPRVEQKVQAARSRRAMGSGFPAPRFLTQMLDHYDGTNTDTWQQAYYVNDTYFVPGSDTPVYLCVGGEGPPLDGSVVVASVHCNVAVELLPTTKAIMFALEHRFYGCHNMSACPVTSFNGNAALKTLSSRQALGDLAYFVQFIRATYNLPSNKIIAFGGSYPGMLAGWARLKFPHLIHAAIASSAPVEAIVDMTGYYNTVAHAYSVTNNGVGGSAACQAAIATGHAAIGQLFTSTEGRQRLASLFGMSPDFYAKYENQATFAGNGVAYFPAQTNDPSCMEPACNIGLVCKIMVNSSWGDEVARLAQVRNQQALWLPRILSTTISPANELPDFWGYQTCTEFAFYQTCEIGSACFFTQGYLTLNATESFCGSEFGISASTVARNVAQTNAWYGARQLAGTCLLYPNGEVDPWSSQSILNSTSPGVTTLWVPGASHHAWTHPSLPTDQPSVVAARQAIRNYVAQALSQPCDQAQA